MPATACALSAQPLPPRRSPCAGSSSHEASATGSTSLFPSLACVDAPTWPLPERRWPSSSMAASGTPARNTGRRRRRMPGTGYRSSPATFCATTIPIGASPRPGGPWCASGSMRTPRRRRPGSRPPSGRAGRGVRNRSESDGIARAELHAMALLTRSGETRNRLFHLDVPAIQVPVRRPLAASTPARSTAGCEANRLPDCRTPISPATILAGRLSNTLLAVVVGARPLKPPLRCMVGTRAPSDCQAVETPCLPRPNYARVRTSPRCRPTIGESAARSLD